MIHDVTAKTKLARLLEERARTDALTGLPNRAAWTEELERGLARAGRAGVPAAILFLDLNGFKRVNDEHGHAIGDAVLREFARRLQTTLRKSDFIARLAGDEFVVLLDRADGALHAPARVAEKVAAAMLPPMRIGQLALTVTPSVGWAVMDDAITDADALMRRADEAMYAAKRASKAATS